MMLDNPKATERRSHIFQRDVSDHYVEPEWTTRRLFAEEKFLGPVLDPCCGWGRVIDSARAAGYEAFGSDIVIRAPRKKAFEFRRLNILSLHQDEVYNWWRRAKTIVSNPPFDQIEDVAQRCLALAETVALICPVRRLPAAHLWLEPTPLATVLLMTPRPSMPPGSHIRSGGKVGGGTVDYAWLIWRREHKGPPLMRWLHRDGDK